MLERSCTVRWTDTRTASNVAKAYSKNPAGNESSIHLILDLKYASKHSKTNTHSLKHTRLLVAVPLFLLDLSVILLQQDNNSEEDESAAQVQADGSAFGAAVPYIIFFVCVKWNHV